MYCSVCIQEIRETWQQIINSSYKYLQQHGQIEPYWRLPCHNFLPPASIFRVFVKSALLDIWDHYHANLISPRQRISVHVWLIYFVRSGLWTSMIYMVNLPDSARVWHPFSSIHCRVDIWFLYHAKVYGGRWTSLLPFGSSTAVGDQHIRRAHSKQRFTAVDR